MATPYEASPRDSPPKIHHIFSDPRTEDWITWKQSFKRTLESRPTFTENQKIATCAGLMHGFARTTVQDITPSTFTSLATFLQTYDTRFLLHDTAVAKQLCYTSMVQQQPENIAVYHTRLRHLYLSKTTDNLLDELHIIHCFKQGILNPNISLAVAVSQPATYEEALEAALEEEQSEIDLIRKDLWPHAPLPSEHPQLAPTLPYDKAIKLVNQLNSEKVEISKALIHIGTGNNTGPSCQFCTGTEVVHTTDICPTIAWAAHYITSYQGTTQSEQLESVKAILATKRKLMTPTDSPTDPKRPKQSTLAPSYMDDQPDLPNDSSAMTVDF